MASHRALVVRLLVLCLLLGASHAAKRRYLSVSLDELLSSKAHVDCPPLKKSVTTSGNKLTIPASCGIPKCCGAGEATGRHVINHDINRLSTLLQRSSVSLPPTTPSAGPYPMTPAYPPMTPFPFPFPFPPAPSTHPFPGIPFPFPFPPAPSARPFPRIPFPFPPVPSPRHIPYIPPVQAPQAHHESGIPLTAGAGPSALSIPKIPVRFPPAPSVLPPQPGIPFPFPPISVSPVPSPSEPPAVTIPHIPWQFPPAPSADPPLPEIPFPFPFPPTPSVDPPLPEIPFPFPFPPAPSADPPLPVNPFPFPFPPAPSADPPLPEIPFPFPFPPAPSADPPLPETPFPFPFPPAPSADPPMPVNPFPFPPAPSADPPLPEIPFPFPFPPAPSADPPLPEIPFPFSFPPAPSADPPLPEFPFPFPPISVSPVAPPVEPPATIPHIPWQFPPTPSALPPLPRIPFPFPFPPISVSPVAPPVEPPAVTIPDSSGAYLDTLEFVVTVGFGTPARAYTVMFDTGSDLSWIQCKPCSGHCYKQHDPIFNPAKSSTYTAVPCGHPECKAAGGKCDSKGTCTYKVEYGDSSSTSGVLSHERLSLTSSSALHNFVFGCGEKNLGSFGDVDGLIGLGRGQFSLSSQATASLGGTFSYCLPSHNGTQGYLSIGSTPVSDKAAYTAMVLKPEYPSFYFVELVSIDIGGYVLPVPPTVFTSAGTLLDSGTVLTYLPEKAYALLRDRFKLTMKQYKPAPPQDILDTCYDFTGQAAIFIPAVSFKFNDGAVFDLDFFGVLLFPDEETAIGCLAFAARPPTMPFNIIGNTQQRSAEVIYDVAKEKIGFVPASC